MAKSKKNNNTNKTDTLDPDLELASADMFKSSNDSMDQYIDDPSKIYDLNFSDCFDIIHRCCNPQDKRTIAKYANVIVTAAENMKIKFHDLSTKVNVNSVETKNILLEIKNKLNAPVPYNLAASKNSYQPPNELKQKSNDLALFIKAKNESANVEINSKVNFAISEVRKNKPHLKINKIIRNNKGNIIKIPHTSDLNILINYFKSQDHINQIADVYVPKPLDPTIVLKKVSKFTRKEDLPNILANINEQLKDLQSEIKVLFEFRSNSHFRDVVLRVSPKVFDLISNLDFIFTDLEAIKFHHRVFVRQCKFCFQFNSHKSNDCPRKNNPVCSDCGMEGVHQCSKANKCVNCVFHFKNNVQQSLICHKPNQDICPLYRKQIERILQITAFKPVHLANNYSSSTSMIEDVFKNPPLSHSIHV